MAIATGFQAFSLPIQDVWYGNLESYSASKIVISLGAQKTIYTGSFSYSANGAVSGTLQSVEEYNSKGILYRVTNIGQPAAPIYSAIQLSGDAVEAARLILDGDDTMSGSDESDNVSAFNGNDFVNGNGGNDTLFGNAGDDTLDGGDGNDRLDGGPGDDLLIGGAGSDTLIDLDGDNILRGGDGTDVAEYTLPSSFFTIEAQSASVLVTEIATGDANTIRTDVEKIRFTDKTFLMSELMGGGSSDGGNSGSTIELPPLGTPTVTGTDANERLSGTADVDVVDAGAGDDIVKTGDSDDDIELGDGDDLVLAGDGNDTIRGGDGNDIIKPGRGDDSMDGGAGDDILVGFRGDEVLVGGEGNDTLLGNLDDDTLIGGSGDDRMQGGPGRDVFVFDDPEFGHDRIVLDFRPGSDTLDFTDSGLTRDDLVFTETAGKVKITVTGHDSSIVLDSSRTGDLTIAQFNDDTLIF